MRIRYSIADWLEQDGVFSFPDKLCLVICIGGSPGRNTCQASCSHCFLRHTPKDTYGGISSIEKEKRLLQCLEEKGHYVIPMIADTFSWNGRYLEEGVLCNTPLYDDQQTLEHEGIAWTSGVPLVNMDEDERSRLLTLAKRTGHTIISLTVPELPFSPTPFSGTPSYSVVSQAIHNVKTYNEKNRKGSFKICLTFTIGTYNIDHIRDFIEFGELNHVNYVRFNRFINFSADGRLRTLMLTERDNLRFFSLLKELESTLPDSYPEVLISTDFGCKGAPDIGVPINQCPGGRGLFGIRNGKVYPCNECFQYPIGDVKDVHEEAIVTFREERMIVLRELITADDFDGCIGYALSQSGLLADL